MNDNASEAIGLHIAGIAFHGNISETLNGEVRLEDLLTATAENVLNLLPRAAQVVRIYLARAVQDFGMP
jgi:hypothetical protein